MAKSTLRQVPSQVEEAFEEGALEGLKRIRAFFTYQGNDQSYFQKARMGAATISAYGRIVASVTNREALRLATTKQSALPEKE